MGEQVNANGNHGSLFSIKDWAGLGDVVGHVKDLVVWLLNRRERSLENEAKSLRNEKLRLDNIAFFVELAGRVGCSQEQIRTLIGLPDLTDHCVITVPSYERSLGRRSGFGDAPGSRLDA